MPNTDPPAETVFSDHVRTDRYRFEPRPPATPTKARPGSSEKIAVMLSRAERGEDLHHTRDRRIVTHRSADDFRSELHLWRRHARDWDHE